jgi:hypothetical protein
MKLINFEFLKLRKKSRGWLGPILVFILIMTAFPLTVEILNSNLEQGIFFCPMDRNFIGNDVGYRRYFS